MANNKIDSLLSVVYYDKRKADRKMEDILANICFEIIDPLAVFIYKEKDPKKEKTLYQFNEVIFSKIRSAVKEAHKASTYDDFIQIIYDPISYARVAVSYANEKIEILDTTDEEPFLLQELGIRGEKIYKKFFKQRKRGRKKKTDRRV